MYKYVIYKLTSPSGKSYIGQTNDIKKRFANHQCKPGCRFIYNAIIKYGWGNITKEILKEGLTLEEANHWEERLILDHATLAPNGYNLKGGGYNHSPSEQTRARISKTLTGRVLGKYSHERRSNISAALKGKLVSDSARANMSIGRQGIKLSENHKANISKALKGKQPKNVVGGWNKGIPLTDEHKQILREINLGKSPPNKGKPMTTEQRLNLIQLKTGIKYSEASKLKRKATWDAKRLATGRKTQDSRICLTSRRSYVTESGSNDLL